MEKLGRMKKITNLRSVWPHEQHNFSKWLAEEDNLSLLSETIGIDISSPELEVSVGSFSIDILAVEEGTERRIIIENQLEDTNHDHLGKIITYASGKDAEVIIWIVKRARDEHRQAVEWLNEHTDENIALFLLEIELWKIDNSASAPKFNIVVQPNNWLKINKIRNELNDTKRKQFLFWEEFINYSKTNNKYTKEFNSERTASTKNSHILRVGVSDCELHLVANFSKNIIEAGIKIGENEDLSQIFIDNKVKIEEEIGEKIIVKSAPKRVRLSIERNININEKENWRECFEWYCNIAIKLKGVCKVYGK